jgi:hypothetical protein
MNDEERERLVRERDALLGEISENHQRIMDLLESHGAVLERVLRSTWKLGDEL